MSRSEARVRSDREVARAGPSRASAPEALTADAWYTLIYLSSAERRALAARRRKLWTGPLLKAGLGRREAEGLFERRERWVATQEAGGRTPTVLEQLERLRAWVGGPLLLEGLPDRLDAALLEAPVRLAPGALRAVRSLASAGVPLGIVSNVLNESGTAARMVLDRLGLLPWFRVVVLSCEQRWAKPSPEPFRLAARCLGSSPASTVHIGDLAYDVRGAEAAGMRAWWYVGLRRLNGYLPGQIDPSAVQPAKVVRSWSEVPRRLGVI